MAPSKSKKTVADSTDHADNAPLQNGEAEASTSKAAKNSTDGNLIKQLKAFIKEEMGRQTEDLIEEIKLLNTQKANERLKSSADDRAEKRKNTEILNEVQSLREDIVKLRRDFKNVFRFSSGFRARKESRKAPRRTPPSRRNSASSRKPVQRYLSTSGSSEEESEFVSFSEEEIVDTPESDTSDSEASMDSMDEEYFKTDKYTPRGTKSRTKAALSKDSKVDKARPGPSSGRRQPRKAALKRKKLSSSSSSSGEEEEEKEEEDDVDMSDNPEKEESEKRPTAARGRRAVPQPKSRPKKFTTKSPASKKSPGAASLSPSPNRSRARVSPRAIQIRKNWKESSDEGDEEEVEEERGKEKTQDKKSQDKIDDVNDTGSGAGDQPKQGEKPEKSGKLDVNSDDDSVTEVVRKPRSSRRGPGQERKSKNEVWGSVDINIIMIIK